MRESFFEFKIRNERVKIRVMECRSIWDKFMGLMFKRKSKPLLFVFNKEKTLSIHSFFCQPFIAIWISPSRNSTKVIKIDKWRVNFSGKGQYLLEVPQSDENYLEMTKILNLPDGK